MTLKNSTLNFKFLTAIILTGIGAGLCSALFIYLLVNATNYREGHLYLIYRLPIAGIISTWCFKKFGGNSHEGAHLIIDEIHNPKSHIPLKMTPLILFSTVITHLFGGSAGREGTAVQMGGSLAETIGKKCSLSPIERRKILIIGLSAGFGSVLGAPWAGMFFGSEVIHGGKIEWGTILESGIASFIAFTISKFLIFHQLSYPLFFMNYNTIHIYIFLAILIGVSSGVLSFCFNYLMHKSELMLKKLPFSDILKTGLGGFLLVLGYTIIGSYKYAGLGLNSIQNAFLQKSSIQDVVLKMIFTIITLAFGFKGGEFIPLVFMGSHLGSALSFVDPTNILIMTSLGFCAVFAGASNTPLTCSILAFEFFGPSILPFALIANYLSFIFAGNGSIYQTQKKIKKYQFFKKST